MDYTEKKVRRLNEYQGVIVHVSLDEVELYPGEGESLVIARRREEVRMYISDFALRFLLEHR